MKLAVPTFRTGGHRRGALGKFGLLVVVISAYALFAGAQTPAGDQNDTPQSSTVQPQEPVSGTNPVDLKSLPKNLLLDQKDFWTAPLHMSDKQWDWALPSILAGGLLIKADNTIENHVPMSKSTVSHAVTASNAGVAALTAAGAGLFLLGHLQSDDQKRETGILSGEAAIGALVETELFKYAAGRERPFVGTSPGRFFVGGDSFPSVHASVSWAIASVIAHEYPGPLTDLLAYGVAGGVAAERGGGGPAEVELIVAELAGALRGGLAAKNRFAPHHVDLVDRQRLQQAGDPARDRFGASFQVTGWHRLARPPQSDFAQPASFAFASSPLAESLIEERHAARLSSVLTESSARPSNVSAALAALVPRTARTATASPSTMTTARASVLVTHCFQLSHDSPTMPAIRSMLIWSKPSCRAQP